MEPVRHDTWTPLLDGLKATSLDCVQTSIGLLADRAYGPDSHLRLGWQLTFPTPAPAGGAHVDTAAATRFDRAARVLGFQVGASERRTADRVREIVHPGRPRLVLANAFDLPWLPYRGTGRLEHSYLLEVEESGTVLVVDGYHIDTPGGPARPGVWRFRPAEWDAVPGGHEIVDVELGQLPVEDPEAWLAAAARDAHADGAAQARIAEYADERAHARSSPEVLASVELDVWVLSRERDLHAVWRSRQGEGAEATARAEAWQRLVTQTFLAARRLARGVVPDPALFDQLRHEVLADLDLLPATAAPAADAAVRAVVAEAVREVLGLTEQPAPTRPLRSLPRYDSFRLVEVVGYVEKRLGRPIASDVTGEELQDVAGLVVAFTRAAGAPAS